uniref:Bactericidal permeability-increasing protein n=1 Tax=Echeneis naucrates TaxID=173247 RepID=A0A665WEG7_ECHNA
MSLFSWIIVVLLIATTSGVNPGVKVRLTAKGLEYGKVQVGMAAIQQNLRTIKIPDISGKKRISRIGKVKYRLSNMRILNVELPKSAVDPVPGTGVRLAMSNAKISMRGNWRVKFFRIMKSGSFDLNVDRLGVSANIAIKSDSTGRPVVSTPSCSASVGSVRVKFRGGASWLYNLFNKFINKALRKAMQKQKNNIHQICLVVSLMLILAKVDKLAEIDYSMTSSPTISKSSIDLNMKGEFYNIGRHQEPPFSPAAFSLPPQVNKMAYIGMSAFTANSAGFVYNRAGILTLNITDDMIPKSSPIRLNTRALGTFIPEIARRFPGLLVKMVVKTAKPPVITFQPNNATVQTIGTITAFAIQRNTTLSPLFVLNIVGPHSSEMNINVILPHLHRLDLTMGTSSVGQFQVRALDNILEIVLRAVIIPLVNVKLSGGYPLPATGKMKLMNTDLQILKVRDDILCITRYMCWIYYITGILMRPEQSTQNIIVRMK